MPKGRGDFYPSYKTQCKVCLKAKAAPQRDAKVQYLRDWKRKNPAAHKEWYAVNREKRAADWQAWYGANRKHRAESYAKWARENPHIVNAVRMRRYAAKKNAVPLWADLEKIKAIYAEAARLSRETGIKHEVDHFYPLQGETVCGLHCEANLRVITKLANIRKKNRMPEVAHEP